MTEDENVNSEKLKISISIPLKLPKVFLFHSMPSLIILNPDPKRICINMEINIVCRHENTQKKYKYDFF